MSIIDNIKLALSSLTANKMRTLLTMLGIIIGIGSVIGIVTVGDSLSGSLTDSLSSFGGNTITVSLSEKSSDNGYENMFLFGPSQPKEEDLITDTMIDELKLAFGEQIQNVGIYENLNSTSATYEGNSANIMITGVNSDMQAIDDINIISGRFIKDSDLGDTKNICVISDLAAQSLFGTTFNIIGNTFDVTINGIKQTFYVVGIYEYDSDIVASLSDDISTTMYIPLSSAKLYGHSDDGYQSLSIIGNSNDINQLADDIQTFLASYYTHNNSYTIETSSLQSVIDTMSSMMSTVTIAIGAIAGISLLVGGIGVMNIMLVSITERTREIGVRKALGATENTIKIQFIIESIVICLIGGILGIIVGLLMGWAGANLLGYSVKPSITTCIVSVLFSMSIGIFFGYYPASKAAKLDPIEALRYE